MGKFTAEEKLKAVRREIRLRECVFPSRVRDGRMSQAEADYQIEIFREIARDYERIADGH
jgi:hypothetical protein